MAKWIHDARIQAIVYMGLANARTYNTIAKLSESFPCPGCYAIFPCVKSHRPASLARSLARSPVRSFHTPSSFCRLRICPVRHHGPLHVRSNRLHAVFHGDTGHRLGLALLARGAVGTYVLILIYKKDSCATFRDSDPRRKKEQSIFLTCRNTAFSLLNRHTGEYLNGMALDGPCSTVPLYMRCRLVLPELSWSGVPMVFLVIALGTATI